MSVGAKSAVLLETLHGLHKPLQDILLQFPATVPPGQDLGEVVTSFCAAIRELFAASGTYCWIAEGDDELVGLAAHGAKAASFPGLRLSLRDPSLARQAMETGQAVFVNHVDAPGSREQCILAVPLLAFGNSIGALVVTQDSRLRPFDLHAASAMLVVGSHLGSLLANARLAMELEQEKQKNESHPRAEDLQRLLEVSSRLRRHTTVEQFLQEFVTTAATFLGFHRAAVAVLEGKDPYVRWIAEAGIPRAVHERLNSALLTDVLMGQELFAAEDAVTYPFGFAMNLDQPMPRQMMGAPLKSASGTALGAIYVFDRVDEKPIEEADIVRAKALIAEAALVLDSARNLERLEQHRRRAEDLVDLAVDLNASLELPGLAKALTIRTAQLLGAPASAVVLSSGELRDTVCLHPEPQVAGDALAHRLSCALQDVVQARGRHPVYGDVNALLGDSLGKTLAWKDVEIVPLGAVGGELLGVLCLANRGRALDASEQHLLQAVVSHAAAAIENCRLFGEIARSNRNWGELFDAIGDMLIVHDQHNRLVRINRAVEEAVGASSAELSGVDVRALAPLCGSNEAVCPLCALPDHGNAEYENKAWQSIHLVTTSRITAGFGSHVIHILKDITDRREAERLYRELFDNIHEGLFFSTPEGRFIEVNDALVRMLGYDSRDELLQISIPDQLYLSPEHRAELLAKVEEHGAMRSLEATLRRKDGSLIHALKNVFAVRDAGGRTRQYRGLILDITELKNSQKELQRERDFNLKILNNTQTLIVVADTAGLISYANDRCLEACGLSNGGVVGRPVTELFGERWRTEVAASIAATAEGRQVDVFEAPLLYSGGRAIQHSISLSPMLDDTGNVTSIIALMTDITDAAMLQAKLIHSEKMAAVGQLVSGVAHEVNNPLTAIMGFADLLASSPELPASARKEVEIIFQEAQRTKQIVQNLLSFARQTTPHREEVDVNSILQRTLQLRQYDFTNHGVVVEEHYDDGSPIVFGDPQQLQQVFLNIINNAYDAVSPAPNPPHIAVSTRVEGAMVEISIIDNGVGITVPDRIFDPFFTTKMVGKGTGLGLSICYGIVHEHGGEITCSSEGENKGATFVVRLPLHAADQEDLKEPKQ